MWSADVGVWDRTERIVGRSRRSPSGESLSAAVLVINKSNKSHLNLLQNDGVRCRSRRRSESCDNHQKASVNWWMISRVLTRSPRVCFCVREALWSFVNSFS